MTATEQTIYTQQARRPFCNAFCVAMLAAGLILVMTWQVYKELKAQEDAYIETRVSEELDFLVKSIAADFNYQITALRRMADRWVAAKGTPKDQWHKDAGHYVADFKALTTVEWVDNSYHVRWIEPLAGNEQAVGLNIAFNEERKKALQGAANEGATTITPPLDLVQGYRAVITYIPLYKDDAFDGFMVGIYNTETFATVFLRSHAFHSLNIRIYDGEKKIYQSTDASIQQDALFKQASLPLFNRTWNIAVSPTAQFIASNHSALPHLSIIGGGLLALLMGIATYTALTSKQRSKQLQLQTIALEESEQRISAILATAPDGIISCDKDGMIASANEAMRILFGYDPAELVGEHITTLIPERYHANHGGYVSNYIAHGADKIMSPGREVFGRHKDGHEFPLEIGLSKARLSDGTVRAVATIRDMSIVTASEAKFRAMYENSPDAYLLMELTDGSIIDCNPATEKILLGKKEQILNLTPDQLSPEYQPCGRSSEELVPERIETIIAKGAHRFNWLHKRLNGELFPCDVNISLIDYESRQIMLVGWRDVSEQQKLETEREQLIEKLTDSNEELERFAYVCSHDLQEPLRMISSFSEKLEEHLSETLTDDEKGKKYFHFVTDGAMRAQALIKDILLYSSLDREIQKPQHFEMMELIEVARENLAASLQASGGSITSDKLPAINAHKTQIYQLLQNLINNGLKYQASGTTPHVHVGVSDEGDHWHFSVKDNGIGMEEQHLNKIFDVFQRLHRKEEYSGTGVGLSIVKKIVERHGGTIWVESEVGVGSTFHFTLPKMKGV